MLASDYPRDSVDAAFNLLFPKSPSKVSGAKLVKYSKGSKVRFC